MTVAATPTETWQGLEWRKMQANLFRLQKRICQAAQRNEAMDWVHDKDLFSEEPRLEGNRGKLSRTVLERRGGGGDSPPDRNYYDPAIGAFIRSDTLVSRAQWDRGVGQCLHPISQQSRTWRSTAAWKDGKTVRVDVLHSPKRGALYV